MAGNEIGLEAIFKTAAFSSGLKTYLDGIGAAEGKTTTGASRIASGMAAIGGTVVMGALAAATVAIGAVVGAIASGIPLASDLAETVSKVGIVFGDSAGSVLAFGETAATALGMSTAEALAAAGVYGNLFRAMGMTEEVSADMSTNLVGLAADLASFNNMDPAIVLDKLRAGLSGETEPLKTLGVNLNADAIAAKAMAMGLAELNVDTLKVTEAQLKLEKATKAITTAKRKYGADSLQAQQAVINEQKAQEALSKALQGTAEKLTPAAKAQATYALILEQTTLAQGDFARTSEGLANQTRIAKAQFTDLRTAVGKIGLNIAGKVMQKFNEILGKVIAKVSEWISQMDDASTPIGKITASVTDFANSVLNSLPLIITWFQKAFGFLSDNSYLVIGAIAGITAAIVAWAWSMLTVAVPAIWAMITPLLPAIAVILLIAGVVAALAWAWQNNFLGMRDTLTAFWETTVKPALAELWNWLSINIPLAIQTLSTFWTTVLLPAILAVWAWIQANLFPLLTALWNWLATTIPAAITTLSTFWTTVLLPAITAIWNFITTSLLPLFLALANFMGAVLGLAVTMLAGLWQNVLQPALAAVWSYIQANVLPIFAELGSFISDVFGPIIQWLADFISGVVVGAWKALAGAIASVVEWLDRVAAAIRGLELPSWLTPGTGPTPFETGIRGIGDALSDLASTQLPKFKAELEMSASGSGMRSSFGSSGAPTPSAANSSISNIFNLGGNTIANGMDAAVFEARVINIIDRQMRGW